MTDQTTAAMNPLPAPVFRRPRPVVLWPLLLAACQVAAPPDYRFALDGAAVPADFVMVEGPGDRPMPGDLLSWPFLVLDDEAEQVFVRAPGGRIHRQTAMGPELVALEVRAVADLAALTDAEAAGLRAIEFGRWEPAMAPELARVDARRCLFAFGPLSDAVDLTSLPATCRYLHMHYAEPVDPAGFTRFAELRYLALPWKTFQTTGIALDWTQQLRELRWLDVQGVNGDLGPLAGHPALRTVVASHGRITALPSRPLPALRELRAPFSDCPEAEVARMQRQHPTARIHTTARAVLLDRIGRAVRLQLRTGSSCHPRSEDRVVHTTADQGEIAALLDLLQLRSGYLPALMIPGCDRGVMQFHGADGALLAEVGLIGTRTLRCYRAWGLQPASLASSEQVEALVAWLGARGLEVVE